MKIDLNINESSPAALKRSKNGMATVVFIALLAIMVILLTAEARSLIHLRQETQFLQQQQIKRLNTAPTNKVATTIYPGK
ncbi:MAG TPA: hypothetical protein VFF11_17095 [Candidatus Binatia bacterium]|nr:hypothetical protein [Candidatus Binatia bacterium]